MRYLFIIFIFILVSGKGQNTILPAFQERITILPSQLLQGGASSGQILGWNGSAWIATSNSTMPFSGLRAATTTNTIDNLNFTNTWGWSTLGVNTGLGLLSDGITDGTLLMVVGNLSSANEGSSLLHIENTGDPDTTSVFTVDANNVSSVALFDIQNNNRIGILTADPSVTLDVNGDTRLRKLRITDTYNITGTGTVTASSTISDNIYDQGQTTLTMQLPASPINNQICTIMFFDGITTFTLSGNGNSIYPNTGPDAPPTTTGLGTTLTYKFISGIGWIRQ